MMRGIVCAECNYRFIADFRISPRYNCPVCGQLYIEFDGDLYRAELLVEVE